MASHHSASQWRTWIAQCEQSDLTVARFCQSIGVSVKNGNREERKPGTAGAASYINTIWWPATETGGQAVLWSYVNII